MGGGLLAAGALCHLVLRLPCVQKPEPEVFVETITVDELPVEISGSGVKPELITLEEMMTCVWVDLMLERYCELSVLLWTNNGTVVLRQVTAGQEFKKRGGVVQWPFRRFTWSKATLSFPHLTPFVTQTYWEKKKSGIRSVNEDTHPNFAFGLGYLGELTRWIFLRTVHVVLGVSLKWSKWSMWRF